MRFLKSKKVLSLLVGLALVLGVSHWYKRPRTMDVAYGPCNVEYNTLLGEWDGAGEGSWDDQDYHYQARLYKIESTADTFYPNVNQINAHTLTEQCAGEFNNKIDPNAIAWAGSAPIGARLGTPTNHSFSPDEEIKNGQAEPPIYPKSYGRAAVWADEGSYAKIGSKSNGHYNSVWYSLRKACAASAANECDQEDLISQPGYMFTSDNCPENLDCKRINWDRNRVNYNRLIGRNSYGELKPFYLWLEAMSYRPPKVGTWMVMTFKYPKATTLTSTLKMPATLKAGEGGQARLTLRKVGPSLSQFNINPSSELDLGEISIGAVELTQLNENKTISLDIPVTMPKGTAANTCHKLTIKTTAVGFESRSSETTAADTSCTPKPKAKVKIYTYTATTRGSVLADFEEFKRQAAETYADLRGWSSANIAFKQVSSGGDFTLVLAEPAEVAKFSSGCDSVYSCQVGRYVIINDRRWRKATSSWNESGGSLRNYRHMVINHETGHWLGFGHRNCPKKGSLAPVMQQQSISLQGCHFNPWPISAEISAL